MGTKIRKPSSWEAAPSPQATQATGLSVTAPGSSGSRSVCTALRVLKLERAAEDHREAHVGLPRLCLQGPKGRKFFDLREIEAVRSGMDPQELAALGSVVHGL